MDRRGSASVAGISGKRNRLSDGRSAAPYPHTFRGDTANSPSPGRDRVA